MLKRTTFSLMFAAAMVATPQAHGFSLEGPPIGYETAAFGYEPNNLPRGYPRQIGDENRITIPNIYYACDQTFLDYFGDRGRQEMKKAVQYFNDLPAFSQMSDDLSEFPQVTYRENHQADSLLLADIKSQAMTFILWDLGLTSPEWYMWSVRGRVLPQGRQCPQYQWVIIMRNFDPATWEPSSYVNGALYSFAWVLSCTPDQTYPAPVQVDPTAFSFSAVAGLTSADIGQYYTGLSRDDIGGLRYIYRRENYNYESLPANVLSGGGGGVIWSIVDPNQTNAPVGDTSAVRPGIDKFNFEERPYDSLLSQLFDGFTNQMNTAFVTNGFLQNQSFGRPVLVPDIIFSARDIPGAGVGLQLGELGRSADFFSNTTGSGPGTVDIGGGTPVTYTFNKVGQAFGVDNPFFLSELEIDPELFDGLRWGSFDGTTNAPVMYPNRVTIEEMESTVLGTR